MEVLTAQAGTPSPLLPRAIRQQEWAGGFSELQELALSWHETGCEEAHLLPTESGNQAATRPYSVPLCNLENGALVRQKKTKLSGSQISKGPFLWTMENWIQHLPLC